MKQIEVVTNWNVSIMALKKIGQKEISHILKGLKKTEILIPLVFG